MKQFLCPLASLRSTDRAVQNVTPEGINFTVDEVEPDDQTCTIRLVEKEKQKSNTLQRSTSTILKIKK